MNEEILVRAYVPIVNSLNPNRSRHEAAKWEREVPEGI